MGRKKAEIEQCNLVSGAVNLHPRKAYFYIFRPFKPIIARPRNGAVHEKTSLGGLCIESTIKTGLARRFGTEE